MDFSNLFLLLGFVTKMSFAELPVNGNQSKLRYRLKSLIYDLTHSRAGENKQQLKRQSVCTEVPPAATCDGTEVFTNEEIFKLVKTAMTFRMVQLNNYDQRFNRMKASMKVINGKGGKYEEFQETSKHLLSAIGGDISNPRCLSNSDSDTKTMDKSVRTLDVLQNCTRVINITCRINTTVLNDINRAFFNTCDTSRTTMLDKMKECKAYDSSDPTKLCLKYKCWKESNVMVNNFKQAGCMDIIEVEKEMTNTKKDCKAKFQACKQAQDEAISSINSCGDEATPVMSNFRSMLVEDEDYEDYDYYDYDD